MIGSPDNISGRREKLFVALGKTKHLKSSNTSGGDYMMGDIVRNFCLVEGEKQVIAIINRSRLRYRNGLPVFEPEGNNQSQVSTFPIPLPGQISYLH
jgi:hypothetical protein